jgi:hypothetical protein
MTKPKERHRRRHLMVVKHIGEIEKLVEQLKASGPHSLDGFAALADIRLRLSSLAQR